jgi:hypothetical protein
MRGATAIALACAVLGACSVWPVNQDPAGMNYRRDANRVIMALQDYHRDKGAFPSDLGSLVPAYLSSLPGTPRLQYNPADGSLAFHYIPSWPQLRPVWCNSIGNTTNWRCAEHLI